MATDTPMQLGMVGLGRMGANLVRRLMRDGHRCVVYDMNSDAVKSLAAEGATGAASLSEFVEKLDKPRAVWLMLPAAVVDATLDQLVPLLEPGDTVIDGGNSYYRDDIARAKKLLAKNIHYVDCGTSGGVWGLERGYCLMIGGETEVVDAAGPDLQDDRPRRAGAPSPRRAGHAPTAPRPKGICTAGPSGAGHFVKMVHNGVEYGMMAAIAEGLSIIKHANAGNVDRTVDAETTPLRDPWAYQYDIDVGEVAEVWRRGSVVGVVAGRPDRRRAGPLARARRLHRAGVGLRRGPVDGAGRGRRGRARPGDHHVAVRAVRVARARRVHRQGPLGDAQRVRRPRREEVAVMTAPATTPADVLVIFGITGDLAKKMTFRSLYRLERRRLLDCPIVGVARDDWSVAALRDHARQAIESGGETIDEDVFARFAKRLSMVSGDFADAKTYERVAKAIEGTHTPVFYLEIPPSLFGRVVEGLAHANLTPRARVVVEKPFGHDLASARALNDQLRSVLEEWQIFRIDHFLGKEPAMDIMFLRFANSVFEPLWNRDRIQCVQITMAENFGVEDRGSFYDPVGALRDVVQNHLLQLIGLFAAEPPSVADADGLRDKRVEVFRAMPVGRPRALRARAVRRLPIHHRGAAGFADRDVRRAAAGDRQLALVGGSVLHPGRQGAAGAGHRDPGRLQAPAQAGDLIAARPTPTNSCCASIPAPAPTWSSKPRSPAPTAPARWTCR